MAPMVWGYLRLLNTIATGQNKHEPKCKLLILLYEWLNQQTQKPEMYKGQYTFILKSLNLPSILR